MIKQADPSAAFGAASPLLSDGQDLATTGSAVRSFLRFNVTGLAAGETVTAASLSVRSVPSYGGTSNGPAVWRTSDTTSVTTAESMTWNAGRPGRVGTTAVGNFGAVGNDARVSTKVSGVTGNGLASFELAPESTDGLVFLPREDATVGNRPQLTLTITTG